MSSEASIKRYLRCSNNRLRISREYNMKRKEETSFLNYKEISKTKKKRNNMKKKS